MAAWLGEFLRAHSLAQSGIFVPRDYGTTDDHRSVTPDSKPSTKILESKAATAVTASPSISVFSDPLGVKRGFSNVAEARERLSDRVRVGGLRSRSTEHEDASNQDRKDDLSHDRTSFTD